MALGTRQKQADIKLTDLPAKMIFGSRTQRDRYFLVMLKIDMPTAILQHVSEQISYAISATINSLSLPIAEIYRLSVNQFVLPVPVSCTDLEQRLIPALLKELERNNQTSLPLADIVKISMGYTIYDTDIGTTLNNAFLALSVSEENSNRPYDYRDAQELIDSAQLQLKQADKLYNALRNNLLSLDLQPVIGTQSKQPIFHECLLRIKDTNEHKISAGPFITTAEKLGFIVDIDCFVLHEVVDKLSRDPSIRLSINVSNLSLVQDRWLNRMHELLQTDGLASRIIFEITETTINKNIEQISAFIASAKALGAKVAIDDFGSGHTSFVQLQSLNVDLIKIDGSFIRTVKENYGSAWFIKTIVEFAQTFGLETVAEYVGSEEIVREMERLNINYMQGSLFANITA